jgi:flagellar hook-length control protein FliK
MVPVSHAPDLKASNLKAPTAAHPTPAKTGFQALIDKVARSSHAETGEKPVKVSLDKPKPEAPTEIRKFALEKVTLKSEKTEKSEKPSAEKKEKHDESNGIVLAALIVKPEAAKPEPAKVETAPTAAVTAKSGRDRAPEAKTSAGSDPSGALPLAASFRPAERLMATDERPKVTVIDKRTETKEKEKEKAKTEAIQAVPASQTPLPAPEAAAKSDAVTGVAETKVVFHPTDQGTPFDIKPQNTPVAPRDAATFQQFLIDKGYGQLVEQARITLKDNNAGEIRMTLHPESLGKVKVALNLSDGSLAGQIFVENQSVKDVFQSNMDGLMQAFRDGGWNNLNLQVSVGGDQKRQNDAAPEPAKNYGRQVSGVSPEAPETIRIGAWTDRQVNLTA